jgi:molybdopterin-guanine dinucleotide biosynthesis protein A
MLRLGGIVLCGGQSKRMGRPKAWLPFGSEVLLQRVVRILGETVENIVVVAAPEQDLPLLPAEVRVVRDAERGRGPLQGLAAGLAALRGQVDAAYLSGCDVPFLRATLVRRLRDLLGSHAICVPRVGDYLHPLAAVYRIEVAEAVQRLLAAERLRPVFLFEELPTRIVTAEELIDVDPALESFRNLNTPEDYQTALRHAETADPNRAG